MSVSIGSITSLVDVVEGGDDRGGGTERGVGYELERLRARLALLDRLEERVRDHDRDG